jgi:hypothetical protein
LRAAAGPAASRLVDQINRKAAAKEDVLEAFATIGRGLPRLARLTVSMPEDQRELSGVRRYLIEHVRVIAMQRLPGRVGRRSVGPLSDRVERAGSGDDCPAGREAALFLKRQRLVRGCCCRTCRCQNGERDERESIL